MRQVIIAIMALCMCLQTLAQELEVPAITSVQVDYATGLPVVSWRVNHPDSVDGYIIKRLIVDGQGVISNTYNNVAVIDNNKVFSYIDTSTAYGTIARPADRREVYRVSSYRNSGGRILYSLMSDEAGTIQASGFFDYCSGSYTLSCDAVPSADRYILCCHPSGDAVAQSPQSAVSHVFGGYEPVRHLSLVCQLADGRLLGSQILGIAADGNTIPGLISVDAVTLCGDGQGLSLCLSLSASPSTSRVVLARTGGGVSDSIQLNVTEMDHLVFHDSTADCAVQYSYRLLAYNSCRQLLAQSREVHNFVLSAETLPYGNLLSWSGPDMEGAGAVDVYTYNGGWELLAPVAPGGSLYTHDLIPMLEGGGAAAGVFRYQLRVSAPGHAVESNIVTLERDPVVHVPNALNPLSEIEENRFFRPYVGFVSGYQLTVFNKHGAPVFHTTDTKDGWNGRDRSSHLCPRGSYFYVISCYSASGRRLEKKGWVNLVY